MPSRGRGPPSSAIMTGSHRILTYASTSPSSTSRRCTRTSRPHQPTASCHKLNRPTLVRQTTKRAGFNENGPRSIRPDSRRPPPPIGGCPPRPSSFAAGAGPRPCSAWSRQTTTVKNDGSCSRRPDTATEDLLTPTPRAHTVSPRCGAHGGHSRKGGAMRRRIAVVTVSAMTLLGLIAIGGPAQAKVPGPNGQIVFSRFNPDTENADIFVANPDGTHAHE